MGIKSLLPFITPHLPSKHISSFKNSRVGIDGHAWLHSAILPCAMQLFNKQNTTQYLKVLEKRINVLLKYKITPIFVFDGHSLPSKAAEDKKRTQKRLESLETANEMIKTGQSNYYKFVLASLSITPEIVETTIKFLEKLKIQSIQSPYESDAQLAYLSGIGYIDHILTEDSDLIVHQCQSILYKFKDEKVLHYEHKVVLSMVRSSSGENNGKKKGLGGYSENSSSQGSQSKKKDPFKTLAVLLSNILPIAVLSGSDYLENIPGVAINTVLKMWAESAEIVEMRQFSSQKLNDNSFMQQGSVSVTHKQTFIDTKSGEIVETKSIETSSKHKRNLPDTSSNVSSLISQNTLTLNQSQILTHLIHTISLKKAVPADYTTLVNQAINTFLFQVVYCPKRNKRVYKDGSDTERDETYFGVLNEERVRGLSHSKETKRVKGLSNDTNDKSKKVKDLEEETKRVKGLSNDSDCVEIKEIKVKETKKRIRRNKKVELINQMVEKENKKRNK